MREVEGVIHLAAIVSVDEAIENPALTYDVNIRGTLILLENARKYEVDRFVFASSTAVYGEPPKIPITEDMPTNPINPYGASKLAAEALVNAYAKTYGLSTISLRYFNVYGSRMKTGSYAGVIAKFITAALRGEPLIIYGDGNQIRDFVYVEDVARANVIAIKSKATGSFNVGTGVGTRILELAQKIRSIIKSRSKIIFNEPRPGDIKRSVADIQKTRRVLKWFPKVELLQGLRKTVEYFTYLLSLPGSHTYSNA